MSESKRRRRLQICVSNKLARPDVIKQIEEQGWLVEIEQCLDQCTRCSACAFALVSGRFLFATDLEELLRKLR